MATWENNQIERYSISFAFSLVFNLILFLASTLVFNLGSDIKSDLSVKPERKLFTVESFKKLPSKKLRTVGVKSGRKNTFSTPTKTAKGNGATKTRKGTQATSSVRSKKSPKSIDMSQLGANPNVGTNTKPLKNIQRQLRTVPDKSKLLFTAKPPVKQRLRKQQKQLQGDILKKLSANSNAAQAIAGKGFNLQFDPPEGIPEDELNSVEKIFYSFQKRTYETYLNSFIKTYYNILRSKPILKKHLNNDRHRLNGRVTFDRDGNITSVKILQSTQSDEVHDLFLKTLDLMRKVPNPPKDLLQKDGTFTIYYSLYIN
ncbi:hypothetical protein A9Q84_08780 [Halobacteriovorax marinus]|uniref:TonB C-terminal domain-containing protein n=1 Tax=Halobacteriovorax marinus TaxID=97084 RepID=A0A1Y5F6C3_9BACT|nr:hypothetical protein A9Q84_08780 [Halobacteriovorax marinus]